VSVFEVPVTNQCSKPFLSTYYDERMRASPALLRTRAPYLIKNTITGFAICSLVIGICMIHL
jgi:cytochrome c oxidase assembly factor 3